MVLLYLSVATKTGLEPLILLSLLAIGGFPVTILLILGLPFFPRRHLKCGNDMSLLQLAQAFAFLYGGECVANGNLLPCRGDKSGWIFEQTTVDGFLGDDLGHWTANVTFEGDDNPPKCIAGAAFASLEWDDGRSFWFGGECENEAVQDAWLGNYRGFHTNTHTIFWKKIPRDSSWPPHMVADSQMANLQKNVLLLFGGKIVGTQNLSNNHDTYMITYAPSTNKLKWEKQMTIPKCYLPSMCKKTIVFTNSNFAMIKVNDSIVLFNGMADPGDKDVGNGAMWYFNVKSKSWLRAINGQLEKVGKNRREFQMGTFGKVAGLRKVLFGGGIGYSGLDTLTDTWIIERSELPQNGAHIYDSSSFKDISISAGPSPPKTKSGAMTGYKDIGIMFGGIIEGKEFLGSRIVKDLWIFEEALTKGHYTWSTRDHGREKVSPSPRAHMSLAPLSHPTLGDFLLLYGGYNGQTSGGTLGDTWLLSMNNVIAWHEWKNERNVKETGMPPLNTYAMAPVGGGVLIYGGILPDEVPEDKSFRTWFFTCNAPPKGITNTLDNDCNWREFKSATQHYPDVIRQRAVALTQSHVILYPDTLKKCTWLFTMPTMPVVEGHWQCIGSFDPNPNPNIVDPSLVAGGSHETAVVFEGLEANLGTINFIFDSGDYSKATWVYSRIATGIPTGLSKSLIATVSTMSKDKRRSIGQKVVLYGGSLSNNMASGDTWIFDLMCPRGYEVESNVTSALSNDKCVACRVGYYNEKGHDAKCNKCPETTTTAGSGSDSISNCNVCDANYCDSEGTKKSLVDQESVACRCKCKKNYISTTCSRKINCLLGTATFDGLFEGKCDPTATSKLWIIIVSSLSICCCGIICTFRSSHTKTKEELDVQLGQVNLYSRLLDESNTVVKSVDKQLKRLQEGWKIRSNDIELLEKVGAGTFANVYRGKWKALDQIDVAIKCLIPNPETKDSVFGENETKVLQSLRHPNLVLMFGAGNFNNTLEQFIVTEYVGGGDLSKVLREEKKQGIPPFPVRKRAVYIRDIVEGMRFLHEAGFLHRDLKAANVLCTTGGRCKITDFGLSRENQASKVEKIRRMSRSVPSDESVTINLHAHINSTKVDMTSFMGSILWMAPEVMHERSSKYNELVDVFSFGMVVYEIITSHVPWEDDPNIKDIEDVIDAIESGKRPHCPKAKVLGFPPYFQDLMEKCWDSDSDKRPTFEEMSVWLEKGEWTINFASLK